MLSYRHAFHAGNYADVLKHIVWQQILQHLNSKGKPYCIVDTHAGAGMYDLQSEQASKTAEYLQGVAKLWSQAGSLPAPVSDYLALLKELNPGTLQRYPGSPWFTLDALRDCDRAWLCELHSSEFPLLEQTIRQSGAHPRKVKAFAADGFETMIAKLPPLERRGAVLIDPSYEVKSDYQTVVDSVAAAHKRFATGTYAIWYPVVDRSKANLIEKGLLRSGIKNIHCYELGIAPDSNAFGMTAAGLYVINPPWKLAEEMQKTLPWLAEVLAPEQGRWRNEVVVSE
jgi:23S rRNA (adenine2030-N6)-methyltransferase